MKEIDLKEFNTKPLSNEEIKSINGGGVILYSPIGAFKEVVEFVIGELADFGQGFWDAVKFMFK
jgi:hypothetical protein